MDLVHRGRLSVQRVQPEAWDVVEQLAEKGGWSEGVAKGTGTKSKPTRSKRRSGAAEAEDDAKKRRRRRRVDG